MKNKPLEKYLNLYFGLKHPKIITLGCVWEEVASALFLKSMCPFTSPKCPKMTFCFLDLTFCFPEVPFCFPEVFFYFSKITYSFPELPFSFPEVHSFYLHFISKNAFFQLIVGDNIYLAFLFPLGIFMYFYQILVCMIASKMQFLSI